MIVIGPTTNFIRDGRPVRSSLLLSDLSGISGSRELIGFAVEIELKVNWMRNTSGAGEHFELMGRKIDEALQRGAVRVDRFRLAKIFADKSQHEGRRKS